MPPAKASPQSMCQPRPNMSWANAWKSRGGTVQRILEALNEPAQVITVNPAEQIRLNHVLAAQGL